jgi:uncharacterized repeat protein (TIGR04138 family)
MQKLSFEEAVELIVEADPRYQADAYVFLKDALEFTRQKVTRNRKPVERHVTVPELLDGLREYALNTYGPMTLTVLEEWGVKSCPDFGEVLFNLVAANQFSVTEEDRREQFEPGFDFHEAFRKPFLPEGRRDHAPSPTPPEA